jgi:phosphoglycolate phosphatase-like HAD superfamily hydrolase
MKLVLFDIDGTLLTSGFAGVDAMRMAFADLHQIADGFAGISMSGKTDRAILEEALMQHRLLVEEAVHVAFYDQYIHYLRRTLYEPERPQRLMPGLPQLLDVLAGHPDVILGLLTGNYAIAAQLKLEAFGIWQYFRVGAYGSDAADRNALVPIAQERTRTLLGYDVPAQRIFVIGDTPRDIACARAHNAWAIAVATGNYPLDVLQAHQPDYCFTDLSDIPAVLRIFTHTDTGGKG